MEIIYLAILNDWRSRFRSFLHHEGSDRIKTGLVWSRIEHDSIKIQDSKILDIITTQKIITWSQSTLQACTRGAQSHFLRLILLRRSPQVADEYTMARKSVNATRTSVPSSLSWWAWYHGFLLWCSHCSTRIYWVLQSPTLRILTDTLRIGASFSLFLCYYGYGNWRRKGPSYATSVQLVDSGEFGLVSQPERWKIDNPIKYNNTSIETPSLDLCPPLIDSRRLQRRGQSINSHWWVACALKSDAYRRRNYSKIQVQCCSLWERSEYLLRHRTFFPILHHPSKE